MARRLQIDLDGTLHSYRSGWRGTAALPDPPVPGALAWLSELVRRRRSDGEYAFDVVIFTARVSETTGAIERRATEDAIRAWFRRYGFAETDLARLEISDQKRAAWLTLDDRALRFTGRFPTTDEIEAFRPWYGSDHPEPAGAAQELDTLEARQGEAEREFALRLRVETLEAAAQPTLARLSRLEGAARAVIAGAPLRQLQDALVP